MENNSRDAGIDIVKAISIVLVLVWHLQPVTNSIHIYGWGVVDFFYRYITLLAVPTFICISLYLFIKKSLRTEGYWKKRLLRLIQLFLFWTCIQFIFYLLTGGKLPLPLNSIIPGGGPELPYVGGSVFYFLFALIICTGVTALFLKLSETVKAIASAAVIALSILHFAFSPLYCYPIDTQAMENYYLYIPIAYYLLKYPDKFIYCRKIFLGGYLLAIFYEDFFASSSCLPAYGRLSILLGVLSFISLFLSGKFTPHRPTRFLAQYSLGIFALHKYWLYIVILLMGTIKNRGQLSFLPVVAEPLLLFITTVIFTFLSVYLLSKTKMRTYIS